MRGAIDTKHVPSMSAISINRQGTPHLRNGNCLSLKTAATGHTVLTDFPRLPSRSGCTIADIATSSPEGGPANKQQTESNI